MLTCPLCKEFVWRKPKAIHFLTQFIAALSDILGVPQGLAEPSPAGDPWEGIFRPDLE
jgi:hypothetical protein